MKNIAMMVAMAAAFTVTVPANAQTASAQNAEAAGATLPAAAVVDADMDLERTMKMMGRNFKALNGADNLLEMKKEIDELATFASQAEAVGLDPDKSSDMARDEFKQRIQKLRRQIAELQQAVEQQDNEKAQALFDEIKNTRRDSHKFFEV